MAKKVVTTLIDDIDGAVIGAGKGETVMFALDGVGYEIDLTNSNSARLREVSAPYMAAGRIVAKLSKSSRARPTSTAHSVELAAIREWARANGHTAPSRGRIPVVIIDAYQAARK